MAWCGDGWSRWRPRPCPRPAPPHERPRTPRRRGRFDHHGRASPTATSRSCSPSASTTPTTWTRTTARRRSARRPQARKLPLAADPRVARRALLSTRSQAAPPPADELERAAPPVPPPAARRRCQPRGHAVRREDDLRRGVAGAVRRGDAAARARRTSRPSSTSWTGCCPGHGPLIDRYDGLHAARFVDPEGQAGRRLHRRHRRVPPPHAPPRRPARGRDLHRRVRDRQVLERLQLVPGQLPQRDPGQHRPAGLHRPRHRPRLPRGLSRPPRLQRAAREAPRARARAGRSSPSTRSSARSR